MTRLLAVMLVPPLAAFLCWSCQLGDRVCAGVGYDALIVTVRDDLGHARALGSTVILYDGPRRDVRGLNLWDSLSLHGGDGGHDYDILVTKPWYANAWAHEVRTPDVGCFTGHSGPAPTVTVPIVLRLVAGAPPVRSVDLLPGNVTLDRLSSRTTALLVPVVDADPGVSQSVRWSISGDTGSVFLDRTTGRLTYRCLPVSGYLTLTATSVVDSTVAGTARIAVQGHPAATNDPPCG